MPPEGIKSETAGATTGAPVDDDSIVDEVHAIFSKVVVERIMRRERTRHEMRAHGRR